MQEFCFAYDCFPVSKIILDMHNSITSYQVNKLSKTGSKVMATLKGRTLKEIWDIES